MQKKRLLLFAATAVAISGLALAQSEAQSRAALSGLLDFPAIYADSEPSAAAQTLDVRERPSATSAVIAHLDRKGIRLAAAPDYVCTWARDLDVSKAPMVCVFSESGYEIPALAVFGAEGQWFRIAFDAGHFGWVQAAAGYHSLADLLGSEERLTHLTPDWDGRVYREPGKAPRLVLPLPQRRRKDDPTRIDVVPYRALAHAVVAGRLWLKVEILDEVCGARDPRVLHTGWVPAQSPEGELWAWFFSRGC